MSHEHHHMSNHQKRDCLLKTLLRLTAKKPIFCINGPLWENPLVTTRFPAQRANNATRASMPWYHHVSHYSDVIIASQITGHSIVCLIICSGPDQRKQTICVTGLCEGFPQCQKGPVIRIMFPFYDVIKMMSHEMSLTIFNNVILSMEHCSNHL